MPVNAERAAAYLRRLNSATDRELTDPRYVRAHVRAALEALGALVVASERARIEMERAMAETERLLETDAAPLAAALADLCRTAVRPEPVCDCADPHGAHRAFIYERGDGVRHYPQTIVADLEETREGGWRTAR